MRVLIGIPAYDGIVAEAQESILGLAFRVGRDMPHVDLAVKVMHKREQFRARNALVDGAIGGQFDYLLMLDDDMVVPPDLLARLLAHDKDIVGALYYQRGGAYNPVIMKRRSYDRGDHRAQFIGNWDPMITTHRGLHKVDIIGGGCMLFDVAVFKQIVPPYFETERNLGTDISICGRLQDAGFEVYVDTSIELGHVGEKKIITSRTVPIAERVMATINQELAKDIQGYLGIHEEMMLSQMQQAATKEARQAHWNADPDNWVSLKAYYADDPDWHILNLGYFNLFKSDIYKEWVITEGVSLLPKGGTFLDYGAGLGHLSVPLAERGFKVGALDLRESASAQFLSWRKDRRALSTLECHWLDDEAPTFGIEAVDGACCISVMDHLPEPYEAVRWIRKQLKPGAFFVCEWQATSGDDEPQHLDRYDVLKFPEWMRGIGFDMSPEYPWLFFAR